MQIALYGQENKQKKMELGWFPRNQAHLCTLPAPGVISTRKLAVFCLPVVKPSGSVLSISRFFETIVDEFRLTIIHAS